MKNIIRIEKLRITEKSKVVTVVFVLILIFAPHLFPGHNTYLLALSLVMAIFAMSFNLLFRYLGLLSFGQAAYFGTAAYVVVLLYHHLGIDSMPILFLTAVAVATALAASFGYICVKYTEFYFAILTLAIGELLYFLAIKLKWLTNGTDGLGITYLPLLWTNTLNTVVYYYLVLIVFLISVLFLWRLTHSPFGLIIQTIRDNPTRIESIGVKIRRYQWITFIIAGVYAGVAGALVVPLYGHIVPDILRWHVSGEAIFMCLLGGYTSFLGPIIGALIYTFIKDHLIAELIYWQLVLGIIIVFFALMFREGIVGLVRRGVRGVP